MMIEIRTLATATIVASALSLGATPSYAKPIPGLDVSPRIETGNNANPRRAAIPARCRVNIRDASGERSAYRSDCLTDHFSQSDALPASCEQVLQTQRGNQAFFEADCLSDAGWTLR